MSDTGTVVAMEPQDQPVAAITPMELLQRAVDSGADVDKLERLMGLQERWEASEARKAFVAALSAFKADPPTVTKTRKAGFDSKSGGARTEYIYATLADCVNVIAPALAQHGLSHGWKTSQAEGRITVTCTLTHRMGHSEEVSLTAGADATGSKNPIQQVASTVSYLERYTLLAITGLAAEGQDDDAEGLVEMISAEQKETLIELIKETRVDSGKFCEHFGVPYIDQLPAARFEQAKRALEQKKRQQQGAK